MSANTGWDQALSGYIYVRRDEHGEAEPMSIGSTDWPIMNVRVSELVRLGSLSAPRHFAPRRSRRIVVVHELTMAQVPYDVTLCEACVSVVGAGTDDVAQRPENTIHVLEQRAVVAVSTEVVAALAHLAQAVRSRCGACWPLELNRELVAYLSVRVVVPTWPVAPMRDPDASFGAASDANAAADANAWRLAEATGLGGAWAGSPASFSAARFRMHPLAQLELCAALRAGGASAPSGTYLGRPNKVERYVGRSARRRTANGDLIDTLEDGRAKCVAWRWPTALDAAIHDVDVPLLVSQPAAAASAWDCLVDGSWAPFDARVATNLENAFVARRQTSPELQRDFATDFTTAREERGARSYRVDWGAMEQVCVASGRRWPIRRVVADARRIAADDKRAQDDAERRAAKGKAAALAVRDADFAALRIRDADARTRAEAPARPERRADDAPAASWGTWSSWLY
ncbi:hypothetical protein M885DRAFT_612498 [Pelagophyceae sp. CCMP2097]|nr:hypothetical protein M885DRAFT_612498 [Pelagophyceae sp. CCMP2097]